MPQQRYLILDGMRGIAAIMVMLYHYTLAFRLGELKLGGHVYHLLHVGGPLAVDFFFMLSGFVLSSAYGERFAAGMTVRGYATKRLIRLYPMYALGMLIGVVAVLAAVRASGQPIDGVNLGASIALSFAMVPDYVGIYGLNLATGGIVGKAFPLNPPGWSLFFELLVSITLLPLWHCATRKIAALIGVSILIVAVAGYLVVENAHLPLAIEFDIGTSRETLLAGFPRAMIGFYLGVLLFRGRKTLATTNRILGLRLPALLLFLLLALCLSAPYAARGLYPALFILLLGPLLLTWGARANPGGRTMTRISHLLGWISFPIYCVHFPVGQLVFQFGALLGLSPWALVGLATFTSMIVAALTCKYLEEPVRVWLARRAEVQTRSL